MKLIVLLSIIASVSSSSYNQAQQWPWQVGKIYYYDVKTYTWTKFEESINNGNAFKTQFIVRVKAPGRLLAKLENPLYTQFQERLTKDTPPDLKYKPVDNITNPFEILVDGGRIISFNLPSVSLPYENLMKGLVSALQVDLSTFGAIHNDSNYFNKESFQGIFKKMELDITGQCETLYSVSPMSAEWHRELPKFVEEDEPVEIFKSKNYGSCKKYVSYHFGVPKEAIWKGIAYDNDQKQFIKHTSEARVLAGRQGTIYKAEVTSSVLVNPLIFGKQKAEVLSVVKFLLSSIDEDHVPEWKLSKNLRQIDSLLYSMTEPSPMFVQTDVKNVVNAQTLLHEITPMLQNANNISKAKFLLKFNILVSLIASLTPEQLNQMTNSIEVTRNSKDVVKNNLWIIYRNAVAQAGTINSFHHIKSWILNKIIEGQEAAEAVAFIPRTLRYPTIEFITELFNFALSPDIKEQNHLNTTTLLVATKLMRMRHENIFIVNTAIPRLSEELKLAIENGYGNKAQIYVQVLGNLGHPNIFKVFAPYLEGRVTVTKYLRTHMVNNLKILASLKNKDVRAILFTILKNTAENYEVRVAAALNLFLSFPTVEMFQVMAHMTNHDPSTQVRSVLSNSIISASKLKSPEFSELAKSAQAVMDVVSKDNYGHSLSTSSISDSVNDEVSVFKELSFIGSENNILPKYLRLAMKIMGIGITEENQIALSVSDVKQLVNLLTYHFTSTNKVEDDFKYPAKKVAKILEIKRVPRDKLEGALFTEFWNQQNLITFSETDLNDLIKGMSSHNKHFIKGIDTSYTKLISGKQISVMFPLVTGMPFIFEYNEPTVLTIGLQSHMNFMSQIINNNVQFTYARNMDGRVGFIDTLGDVYAITGVVNNIQVNTPFLLKLPLQTGELKMSVVVGAMRDIDYIQFSVWPYTTVQKKNSLKTIFEEPSTKFIKRLSKTISTDFKFGQHTGIILNLHGYSYSSDYKNINLADIDIFSSAATILHQKDIAFTQFNLKFAAKESKNRIVTFSALLKKIDSQKDVDGEMGPPTYTEYVTPNNEMRRQKLIKQVAAGLTGSRIFVGDFSIAFAGQQNVAYILTTTLGLSYADYSSQAAVFLKYGTKQANAVFKIHRNKISFDNVLQNDFDLSVQEAKIMFENEPVIQVELFGKRTQSYAVKILEDTDTKQCLNQMATNNLYQKECSKMLSKNQSPDLYKGTIHYNVTPVQIEYLLNTNGIFKLLCFANASFNSSKAVKTDTIEFKIQRSFYDTTVHSQFVTKYGTLNLDKDIGNYFALFDPFSACDGGRYWFTNYLELPHCSVDFSKVWTFSGRSYDYSLTSSWHVVMLVESDDSNKENLVILARRRSSGVDVYVSYKTTSGSILEMDITPTNISVKTNALLVSQTVTHPVTEYRDEITNIPVLEYYKSIFDGVLIFKMNDAALRMVYDTQRLIVFINEYRSTTSGICGQSTSQISDDYKTPWGLVDLAEHYGASFTLDDEFSDPMTLELKRQAKLVAYQPVTKFSNILYPDDEWSNVENESIKGI